MTPDLKLRALALKDLEDYFDWNLPTRAFHKYNGPYYARRSEAELSEYIENLRTALLAQNEENVLKNKMLIVDKATDGIIGEVSWYWKSEETLWMEIGIVIFNENYWGRGIGTMALKMWIDQLFHEKPELVRLGLATWSGNLSMMKVAEKLGMTKEAVYRKARIVNGRYYDAVSFGILREEWNI